MSGYIAGFTVYTLAVIGVLFIAFIIAKKSMMGSASGRKNQFLSVETSLNIAPRKTLHVIKAGKETFLISTDTERTTFLTKLACENIEKTDVEIKTETTAPAMISMLNITAPNSLNLNQKQGIMRGILDKLSSLSN